MASFLDTQGNVGQQGLPDPWKPELKSGMNNCSLTGRILTELQQSMSHVVVSKAESVEINVFRLSWTL
jgi:hypothetical protein